MRKKALASPLQKKNRISAYPTFLFFSPDGDLLLGGVGGKPATAMITIGKTAVNNYRTGISLQALQAEMDKGNRDPIFLRDYIKKLSSLLLPTSDILEKYLDVIPRDSLYALNTLRFIQTSYRDRMLVKGIAFKVLLHAYKKYPVKSMEMMSPWNTLRGNLLTFTDSAGHLQNSQWLNDIFHALDKIDTIPEIAMRDKCYFLCRYYAASGDSINFWKQAQNFSNRYIIYVNTDSLYSADRKHAENALKIKFNNEDINSKNKRIQKFLTGYLSDTRLTVAQLSDIKNYARRYFHLPEDRLQEINEWLEKGKNLYKNNPVFVNSYVLNSLD